MACVRCLLVVLGLVFSSFIQAADNGEISVSDVHAWSSGDIHLLDAQLNINLSSGAEEALVNGVPLTFELQVQLVRKHAWMWDSVETEHVRIRQLEYYPLSRSYLVKDDTGLQSNFSRLEDALVAAGSIRHLLFASMPLDADGDYYVRLRGNLDIEALPTPVRLLAYVSSGWDMDSEWYAWPIDR